MIKSRIVLVALAAVVFLMSTAAHADAAPGGAEAFIRDRQASLNRLMDAGKDAEIQTVFDSLLDYEHLAQYSLGKHAADRSDAERAEFGDVLKQLVQRAYRRNLKKTRNYKVTYDKTVPIKDGVVVSTVARHGTDARAEPVHIEYKMHKVDAKWRIFDIVTEESSMARNYRRQFSRIIKKKGFDDLMKRLRKKLNK
ncbi:MAG: ABC transporter substrate-binding protein [Polyangiaceae bacterium]|nr:ABC transporter substrate-binding protein [Polyangiaceae bacterium]